MRSNLHIAWRFITSRKRSMLMSLTGISFGIAFFVVTQAQTSGFEKFFIQTILGTDGAVRISERFQNTLQSIASQPNSPEQFRIRLSEGKKIISGIEYPSLFRKELESFSQVTGISEIVKDKLQITSNFNDQFVELFGINLQDHLKVSNLSKQIILGKLTDFEANHNTIILGSRVAKRLSVNINDSINLNAKGHRRSYKIVAIFETGVAEIDDNRVFIHLQEARSLLEKPFGNAIFQINLLNPTHAPQFAEHIRASYNHNAISWQQREKVWLDVFRVLRISAGITVFAIILISGLGIFNTLAMLVMEKTKEIAILRSMGYTQKDVAAIFLLQGTIILAVGTLLGWIFAALATEAISNIPIHISGVFATESFIVNWSIYHYLLATFLAGIVVLIASYIPARRASKLEPGTIIRGTSA